MKNFLVVFLFAACTYANAQTKPAYNKALADSLGADEYGMKMYVLAILKTGPAKIENKAATDSLFKGHMNNIERLVKEGKIIVAGPLKKNDKTYRGIFILNAASIEEAQKLVDSDPAVKAGIFDAEFYQWYGSAALPTYLPNHDKIEKGKP
jgi:uncharacterized protein